MGRQEETIDDAWKKEIDRRLRAFREGTAKIIPWEPVKRCLRTLTAKGLLKAPRKRSITRK